MGAAPVVLLKTQPGAALTAPEAGLDKEYPDAIDITLYAWIPDLERIAS